MLVNGVVAITEIERNLALGSKCRLNGINYEYLDKETLQERSRGI